MRIVALIFSAAILLAACSDDKIVNPNGPDILLLRVMTPEEWWSVMISGNRI